MITETLAREASNSPKLKLESFDEFVGVGIIPKRPHSKDMVVAIYVSRPNRSLSRAFKETVPTVVEVSTHGRSVFIPTKIVNVGNLTPG
jgi:hypothetical protein